MDKHTFIKKVLSLYSFVTDKDNEGSYYDTYSRVLTKKIDYEKLFDMFANEYKDKFPPPAAYIKDLAKKCYLEKVLSFPTFGNHIRAINLKTGYIGSRWASDKTITLEQAQKYLDKYEPETYRVLEVY
jgi:hypothetical protein